MAAGPVAKQTASVYAESRLFPQGVLYSAGNPTMDHSRFVWQGKYTIEIVASETFFLRIVQVVGVSS